MKFVKCLLAVSCTLALLTACSSEPQEVLSAPSSLEELGYHLDQDAIPPVVLEDTIFRDEETFSSPDIVGSFTVVSGYWHEFLGSEDYPMAILQAVPANTTKIKQHPLPIDVSEWEQYQIFSNKDIIVYDLYPLYYPQGDMPSLIREQVEQTYHQTEADHAAGNIPEGRYHNTPLIERQIQTHYLDYLWDYYQRSLPNLIVKDEK